MQTKNKKLTNVLMEIPFFTEADEEWRIL